LPATLSIEPRVSPSLRRHDFAHTRDSRRLKLNANLISYRIAKDPHDPTFFTNRAVTRIRLEKWDDVEHDARAAINIYGKKDPASLKSSVYLAEALLALNRPQEAYDLTVAAYQFSLDVKHAQSEKLSGMLLRAKKALWEVRETARLHEMDETLKSLEELINADLARAEKELQSQLENKEIGEIGYREDLTALQADAQKKISHVREAFEISSKGAIQERVSISPPKA
jgi:STIP1 family protein 1